MPEAVEPIALWGSALVELLGISIIVGVALYTLIHGAKTILKRHTTETVYRQIRQRLGRGILLGLEFLVAADIIRTVAIELTFSSVGVLAIVVLIRTFLSFTLDVELTGRWPWQNKS
ncbi:MAG: DUF1622 domain-containing protein [Pseudohongiella sp.]|nr:DUF1622 domain-containing protein [Pseudohongiella sp.]MDO9520621.1 DUF1622 domain-containing protein [Pseudohongiella sp.]MDP2127891.1 DUF1622 domain-containing protein [Pseudohongiella sp.]